MTLKFKDPGYVYIMSNESLTFLKIGYTQNSPYDRAEQLYESGVPTPFTVEKFFFVEDAPQCEELVHIRLNRYRVNSDREFFRVDLDRAERAVEQAIEDLRERLWSKQTLKNEAKDEKGLVVQYSYSNPKVKEIMKTLKESKYPMTVDQLAEKVKLTPAGTEKIISLLNSQEGQILYSREENKVKKYAMAYAFNVQQLTLLSEKYPALELMELSSLFEKKPTNSNSNNYKGQKSGNKDYKPRNKPDQKPTYNKKAGEKQPAQTTKEFLDKKIEQSEEKITTAIPVVKSNFNLKNSSISDNESKRLQDTFSESRRKYEQAIAEQNKKDEPKRPSSIPRV